ncbi:MAG: hypothetical protein HUJ69_00005, partial [Lachnospiraceae bacterium]|nr:hypothetical protein [Lachnospiraceae bacterium]
MTSKQRLLKDVFRGAFDCDARAKELAEIVILSSIELDSEKELLTLEASTAGSETLSQEDMDILTACIDIYLKGEVFIRFHISDNESRKIGRFSRLSREQKSARFLDNVRETEPMMAALLRAAAFAFHGEGLTISVSPQ